MVSVCANAATSASPAQIDIPNQIWYLYDGSVYFIPIRQLIPQNFSGIAGYIKEAKNYEETELGVSAADFIMSGLFFSV